MQRPALRRNENLGDRKERQQRFPWGKEKYILERKLNMNLSLNHIDWINGKCDKTKKYFVCIYVVKNARCLDKAYQNSLTFPARN